jgi:hypothetical protein
MYLYKCIFLLSSKQCYLSTCVQILIYKKKNIKKVFLNGKLSTRLRVTHDKHPVNIYSPPSTADDQWRLSDCISEYRPAPNMGRNWQIMDHLWDNATICSKGMSFWYKKWTNKIQIYQPTRCINLSDLLPAWQCPKHAELYLNDRQ